jgi:ketosteroid isomerase-like protein
MTLTEIVQRGWDSVAAGDMDTLVAEYTEDMIFIMPGQTDLIEGISKAKKKL